MRKSLRSRVALIAFVRRELPRTRRRASSLEVIIYRLRQWKVGAIDEDLDWFISAAGGKAEPVREPAPLGAGAYALRGEGVLYKLSVDFAGDGAEEDLLDISVAR